MTFDLKVLSKLLIYESPSSGSPLNKGTLKWEILISITFFADAVVVILFELLSFVRVCTQYQVINSLIPIPGERYREFSCSITMCFAIFDKEKGSYTLMALNGCAYIVYVFGAGQSEVSVTNEKIFVQDSCMLKL